ncbi:MAG: TonB-dependent receptor plug domain-containing protein, partial [Ferruginibacter sp.]
MENVQRKSSFSPGRVLLLMMIGFFSFHSSTAQNTKEVSGTVTSAATNLPVAGASIIVKGGSKGISTGAAGEFSITVPSNAKTLVVSSVGYARIEVPVGSSAAINIKLIVKGDDLGEVVVVGYGTQKKSTLTGSVSMVNSKAFQDRGIVTNPLSALQGQVPGVIVTRSSAAPGQEGWAFQIRGASSVNAVDPLVILDGVPLSNLNALNSINPQDIESMSFLKDASAAIYGSRAAAGVVLITTKRAKAGKPSIQYNGSVSQKRMGLRP